MNTHYSGIGSRNTPAEVMQVMRSVGKYLASAGYHLRSGAAERADLAFETGCDDVSGRKSIYLPWNGYNERRVSRAVRVGVCEKSLDIAAEFHPAWERCSSGAQRLHARNAYIVLGDDLNTPSEFIVCWTPNAKITGGTGQALRMAIAWEIPVFNLGNPKELFRLDAFVRNRDSYVNTLHEKALA